MLSGNESQEEIINSLFTMFADKLRYTFKLLQEGIALSAVSCSFNEKEGVIYFKDSYFGGSRILVDNVHVVEVIGATTLISLNGSGDRLYITDRKILAPKLMPWRD
jgi:hypothetical protein